MHEDEDYTEWMHWPDEKDKKNNKDRLISIIKHLNTIRNEIGELNQKYEDLTENLSNHHRHTLDDLNSQNARIEEELIHLQSKEGKNTLFKASVIFLLIYIALILSF